MLSARMRGPRAAVPAALFGASLLACLGVGCGGPAPDAPSLALRLVLSDRHFCPGGLLARGDRETLAVRLEARSLTPEPQVRRQGEGWLRLQDGDGKEVIPARPFLLEGEFGAAWESTGESFEVAPPSREGHYTLHAEVPDEAHTSAEFEVWYDERACPAGGTTATTAAVAPPPPADQPVTATLETSWQCDPEGGVEDVKLTVTVRHPGLVNRAVLLPGIEVEGLEELEPFSRVAGTLRSGYLEPGGYAVYEAHGWAETGSHTLVVELAGSDATLATTDVELDCP